MKFKQNRDMKEFDRLYREEEGIYHKIALSLHLTNTAFLILYCMMELEDGCLQKDVCEMYQLSKQTVNSSVKSLEKKGFLTRKPGKGRDMHLYFTEYGLHFTEQNIGPVFEMENATFSGMSEEEKAQLLYLTRKRVQLLKENMQKFLK
ncbi:MarR family winged helix-turn-helix transcriptional regulator [Anaerostipes sp. MSJ-23]|uniref:MarR family winged helix-turn-helix transcriptional regulator n=1 Tax=unclassified Anaerostipes TaxID=2635253 RepID=UPI001C1250E6|nr:MarR family transcriptional regulator [Anaerostipes sp. MSJ-23]MBU5459199.1 winged helix DNA-binding protein [Anaerostipes sp. MSJ-23]